MMRRTPSTAIAIAMLLGCGSSGDDGASGASTSGGTTAASDAADDFDPTTTATPKADLGVSVPEDCSLACDLRVACLGEGQADCLLSCSQSYEGYSAESSACVAGYEDLLACIAALDCDEAAAYQMGAGDYPCASEELGLPALCGGDTTSPVCDALCSTTSTCGGDDPAACLTLCGEALDGATAISGACLDAQTAAFECVAALTCDDYAAWQAGEGNYPCLLEDERISTDCQGEPQ
jgi:hypothetical protein